MKKFLKSGWFKTIVTAIVLVALFTFFNKEDKDEQTYRTAQITRGNIETIVDGNGVIKASESRKVHPMVSAEVKEVLFEEGDFVKKGDVLVKLDSSTIRNSAQSQKISIEQAKLSIENINKQIADLIIVANASGYISNLTISEGSFVNNTMQICDILEEGQYEIVLPFGYNEANKIQVGNSAKIQLLENFAVLDGVVTKVSEMRKLATGSSQVVDVTIKVSTSGYSLEGAKGKGEITVNGTRQGSTEVSTFRTVSSNIVRAKSSGTVQTLNVYNGKFVNVGDVIAVLNNEDLGTSLKNAQLTLQNLNTQYSSVSDQLDNYTITAPIDGTITSQTIEVGDLVSPGVPIITISNKDMYEFEIPVDELDIAKLNYDEEVRVSIDALAETETEKIQGKISKLPLEGVTNGGVTEYYVTIQISGDERIKISMNANAEIVTSSRKNVLMAPVDAVTKENGETTVTVLLEDGTTLRKPVVVGERNVSYVEIKEGLEEGERVVIPQLSETYNLFGG